MPIALLPKHEIKVVTRRELIIFQVSLPPIPYAVQSGGGGGGGGK